MERTQQLYDAYKAHKAPVTIIHERWGYKPMSGSLKQAIGALKAYGLVSVEGEGLARQIGVTERGRRIILNAPDREQHLKDAALSPALFASLWSKYASIGIPSDDILRHHLIFDRNFNEDSVDDVIANFRESLAYSNLKHGDTITPGAGETEEDEEENGGDHDTPPPPRKENRRMTPPAGTTEHVYGLSEGPAILTFPGSLSQDSLLDLKDWLNLVMKKINRMVAPTTPPGKQASPTEEADDEDE